jgi:hypothetical protein
MTEYKTFSIATEVSGSFAALLVRLKPRFMTIGVGNRHRNSREFARDSVKVFVVAESSFSADGHRNLLKGSMVWTR